MFWKLVIMMYKLVISLLLCAAIRNIRALQCHDYVCDGNECYGKGNTCDSGNTPCQVLYKENFGEMTITYTCAYTDRCISTAGNTTYDGLTLSICCETDLCNDGLAGQPFEENQKYCYNTGCYGEGCSEHLNRYLHENNIGAYCKADQNGCEVTKLKHEDPETGEMIVEEAMSCAAAPCFPIKEEIDGMMVKIDCCDGHLCNQDNSKPDSNKDYCHVYSCVNPPCLSVPEAAMKGLTSLCEMPEKGCYFSNSTSLTTGMPMVLAGCVGMFGDLEECEPQALTIDGLETDIQCCDTDRCNVGTKAGMEVDPTKSYCHVYECMSGHCMSLEDAVKLGKTSLCEMTNKGCYENVVISLDSMMISSGCVGLTPEITECIATSMTVDDHQTTIKCCNNDRCNNGMSNKDLFDPNKDYCHAYSCVSSPSTRCLPLSEAIEQGLTSVCEMTDKGCFDSTFVDGEETSILAGCVGSEHTAPDCEEVSLLSDGVETIQRCCDQDRCNHGRMVDSRADNEPFCHVYMCDSTSSEIQCMSLSEAVSRGKTAKCMKSEEGCFAVSDNITTVVAGCIGVDFGMDRCPTAPPVAGGKVVCCGSSGCNSQLYSDNDSGNSAGSNKTGLVSMMLLAVLSMCLSLFL